MSNYQKLYTTLFNAVTAALDELDKQNIGSAKEILRAAQQKTEELYLSRPGKPEE